MWHVFNDFQRLVEMRYAARSDHAWSDSFRQQMLKTSDQISGYDMLTVRTLVKLGIASVSDRVNNRLKVL
jgi:hypothetical protein